MNCTDINTHKDDFFEGKLPLLQQRSFEQHLVECKACNDTINGMRKIQAALYSLSVPEPRNGFVESVFMEVRKQYPEKPSSRLSLSRLFSSHFAAGFTTAMAAGFILWFVSTLFVVQQPAFSTPSELMISLNDAKSVKLMFDAPDDMELVTLSIDLPENVELIGYTGQTSLSWQTSLTKGHNILTLPIIAIARGKGELLAQLNYGDKVKTFHLMIKTTDDGVENYIFQPVKSV